jgi:hypothetical protein
VLAGVRRPTATAAPPTHSGWRLYLTPLLRARVPPRDRLVSRGR